MRYFIQYELEDKKWTNWKECEVEITESNQFIVDGDLIHASYLRVITNASPDSPTVAWYIPANGTLYQAQPNRVGFTSKATPVLQDSSLSLIRIDNEDFTQSAFDAMLDSATDFLTYQPYSAQNIRDLMIRDSDPVQTQTLLAIETPEQQIDNWWKDLYERYRREVETNLVQIVDINPDKSAQINALQDFLIQHHAFIQGTCLDYVAIPTHPVTTTLSEIATKLGAATQSSAIELLIPGIAVESASDHYPDLSTLPLAEAFATHIQLTPKFYLPVQELGTYIKAYINDLNTKVYSPYYQGDSYQLIKPEDLDALFDHSPQTQALRNPFQNYQALSNDQSNLLGQLTILGTQLRLNDAHGGSGQQETAGEDAYAAIVAFGEYYAAVKKDPEQIAKLPEELKQEIDLLLNLSTNKEANNAAGLNSCIGTRGEHIRALTSSHREILQDISLNQEEKTQRIEDAKQLVESLLPSQPNSGCDAHLGLNSAILDRYNKRIAITSIADCDWLYRFKHKDLTTLLEQNPALIEALETQLSEPSDWINFILKIPLDSLQVLIPYLTVFKSFENIDLEGATSLRKNIALYCDDYAPEKTKLFLTEFLTKVKNGLQMGILMNGLGQSRYQEVFAEVQDRLPSIIDNMDDLRYIMPLLSSEQRDVVIDKIKGSLHKIIQNSNDFLLVLYWLDRASKQQAVILENYQPQLAGMIGTAAGLAWLLSKTNQDYHAIVMAGMQDKLPEIINSPAELAAVLNVVSYDQLTKVIEMKPSSLVEIIKTKDGLNQLLSLIEDEVKTDAVIRTLYSQPQGKELLDSMKPDPSVRRRKFSVVVPVHPSINKLWFEESQAREKQDLLDLIARYIEKFSQFSVKPNPKVLQWFFKPKSTDNLTSAKQLFEDLQQSSLSFAEFTREHNALISSIKADLSQSPDHSLSSGGGTAKPK